MKRIKNRHSQRKIHGDNNAKASFSLAGVLILLLAGINVIYFVAVNNDYRSSMTENREIESMNTAINKVHIEIQTVAYYQALNAKRETTGNSQGRDLGYVLNDSFKRYIEDHFPKTIRDCEVSIDDYRISIIHIGNDQTTITPSYTLEGFLNYTAEHTNSALTLNKSLTFHRNIY